MTVSLSVLTEEVQLRCDALTNMSTIEDVTLQASAAKKVEMAGGTLNRTVLDAQLQRVINLSNNSSEIEDLIVLAANAALPISVTVTGVDQLGDMSFFPPSNPLITKPDSSEYLMTGAIAPSSSYPAAALVDSLKCIGRPVASGDLASTMAIWDFASNNAGTYVVASASGLYTSTNYGVTWSQTLSGVWAGVCWTGTHFRAANCNTSVILSTRNSSDGVSWAAAQNLTITGGISGAKTPCVWDGTKVCIFMLGTSIVATCDGTTGAPVIASAPGVLDVTGGVWAKTGTLYVALGGNTVNIRKSVNQAASWTTVVTSSAAHSVVSIGSVTITHLPSNPLLLRVSSDDTTWESVPIRCPAGFTPQRLSTDGSNVILSLLRNGATTSTLLYSPDLGSTWFMRNISSNAIGSSGSYYYIKEGKFIFGVHPSGSTTLSSPRIVTGIHTADYVGTLSPVFNDGVGTNVGSCQAYLKIKN